MAYWWVSQNRTYRHERSGGYVWAPRVDGGGSTPFHWSTMTEVRPGDIIFSYVGQSISAFGTAITEAYDFDRPPEFGTGEAWEIAGRKIDVAYRDVDPPLPLREFVDGLYPLLPTRYSPLTTNKTGTQGYLFALPLVAGEFLLSRMTSHTAALVDDEIDQAIQRSVPDKTTRTAIVEARVGQGRFRSDLVELWHGRCALTGFDVRPLLRASHIKPWRASNNAERIDPMNGLLLAPGCDATFDSGLISFTDDGTMLVSPDLSDDHLRQLGFTRGATLKVRDEHRPFLNEHRKLHSFGKAEG